MTHDHIINTLIEYNKCKEKSFKGCILLNPEDYEDILKEKPDNLEFIDSTWAFRGLPLAKSMAFEFTGWFIGNPVGPTFLDELEFRELLYKDAT